MCCWYATFGTKQHFKGEREKEFGSLIRNGIKISLGDQAQTNFIMITKSELTTVEAALCDH